MNRFYLDEDPVNDKAWALLEAKAWEPQQEDEASAHWWVGFVLVVVLAVGGVVAIVKASLA